MTREAIRTTHFLTQTYITNRTNTNRVKNLDCIASQE